MSEDNSPDQRYLDYFQATMRVHQTWWLSARQLRRSADVVNNFAIHAFTRYLAALEKVSKIAAQRQDGNGIGLLDLDESTEFTDAMHDTGLANVAFMLLSVAIENAMKGILVGRQPDKYVGETFELKGHDLIWLADKMPDVLFDDSQRRFLEKASAYTVWKGRYFNPTSAKGLKPKPGKATHESPATIVTNDEYHSLAAIFDMLFNLMETEEAIRVAERRRGRDQNDQAIDF